MSNRRSPCALSAALLGLAASGSFGQPCEQTWLPMFQEGNVDEYIWTSTVVDDGAVPSLLIGGYFNYAGDALGIGVARWTDTGFTTIGNVPFGKYPVRAIAYFDEDGAGPGVATYYVGGDFSNGVRRWSGSEWEEIGVLPPQVWTLIVFDDGNGPALYAAGNFKSLHRWNGSTWVAVPGFPGDSRAACVFDEDGAGPNPPRLFLGGQWNPGGEISQTGIVRWDGTNWTSVGGDIQGGQVQALVVHDDDGPGPNPAELYASGSFTKADGAPAACIAKWDGLWWSALGTGLTDGPPSYGTQALALASHDPDAEGPLPPALYAGGNFKKAGGKPTLNTAMWDGTEWFALKGGMSSTKGSQTDGWVFTLRSYKGENASYLVAGGNFMVPAGNIARLEGDSWMPLGNGANKMVRTLKVGTLDGEETLLVGGDFTAVGGGAVPAGSIAAWDGTSWSGMAGGFDGVVNVIGQFDSGSGPEIYAGGAFGQSGGISATNLASWGGGSWDSLYGAAPNGPVRAAVEFDDGSGPALYIGGLFTEVGGVAVSCIAKWDGTQWHALGSGVTGFPFGSQGVYALEVHDDGTGPALYVGGGFWYVGGIASPCIGRWDGSAWSGVGGGAGPVEPKPVYGMAQFDDGTGPGLYVGGEFQSMGGVSAVRVACWKNGVWNQLGGGITGSNVYVRDLEVSSVGGSPALYAGGKFGAAGGQSVSNLARWNGSVWSKVGNGVSGEVNGLCAVTDGGGPWLAIGGLFSISGQPTNAAKWNGTTVSALGGGWPQEIFDVMVHDAGDGAMLYVATRHLIFQNKKSFAVSRWNGTAWQFVGGAAGSQKAAYCLGETTVSGAKRLVAGGEFTTIGIREVNRFAVWKDGQWGWPGSGANGDVRAMCVYDDGDGPALYVGGGFTSIDGASLNRIARWDGRDWTPLGAGMDGGVVALLGHDDGSGVALYVAGMFQHAGGVATRGIARWKDGQWDSVGGTGISGSDTNARALAVYDDGNGPSLYLGGKFKSINNDGTGFDVNYLARWDGQDWSGVLQGVNGEVNALAALHEPGRDELYVAGAFTDASGVAAQCIAKWDGTAFHPLGGGVSAGGIETLAAFEDAIGPAMMAGGSFKFTDTISSAYIGRWGCGEGIGDVGCYPDCDKSGELDIDDFICFQTQFGMGDAKADCDKSGELDIDDFICFQTSFGVGCP